MEILSAKIGILAGLFGIIGLVGLALLLASVIFLVVRVANFDSIIPALICVLISLGVIAAGLVLTPMPGAEAEAGLPFLERILGKKDEAPDSGDVAQQGDTGADSGPSALGTETDGIPVENTVNGWNVRLTLPKEWEDRYVTKEDSSGWFFYQKASVDGGEGWLFRLSVVESPVDEDAPEFAFVDGIHTVAEKDGMVLVYTGPTDIPAVEEALEEYLKMYDDISGILDTVEFERM